MKKELERTGGEKIPIAKEAEQVAEAFISISMCYHSITQRLLTDCLFVCLSFSSSISFPVFLKVLYISDLYLILDPVVVKGVDIYREGA